ncbi:MAG: SAM-dependent methyltransferase [Candidatus Methanohalarchaeum thermophilum]|uniref:SAM-dependent methyltransferase n=1 Tax=Methanohalarchaeum thermophilum TaxID=1903181 RepID=A0A1Q6DVW9_METT1|nr:MAG: SAM-dependent methyltransferase [Candidatus Methanohalarchaeum thermophilum]
MKEEKIYQAPNQEIKLDKTSFDGHILDIGGGGEGVIGKLYGKDVISIDTDKNELIEASSDNSGLLRILMDARDLNFLEKSFSKVTSFFTLMYIKSCDRRDVFDEVSRVLKDNGVFEVWDVEIPEFKEEKEEEVFLIPLKISLPKQTIRTGYGVRWRDHSQNANYYLTLAKKKGFSLVEKHKKDKIFHLKFKKRN